MAVLYGIARSVARSVINSLWDAGYSQRGAFNLLKKEGFTYPEKSFRADWREIVQTQQRERFFTEMPKAVRPLRAVMVEKAEAKGSKYVYTFRCNLYDPEANILYENQNYSIGTERLLTVQEAEDELVEQLAGVSLPDYEYVAGLCTNVKRR